MRKNMLIILMAAIILILGLKSSIGAELDNSRQLIVVVTDSWENLKAKVFRFERTGSEWKKLDGQFEAVVGSNGMAWGIGLNEAKNAGPVKKEGDRKAPAGVFRLIRSMGYDAGPPQQAVFPYDQIKEKTYCVDDQNSAYYNQIVNEADLGAPANDRWKSSEIMKRKDILYKWLIVVDHNMKDPKRGAGSCIFIHVWRSKEKGTAGCTAMAETDLVTLLSWLKPEEHPLLIQLPKKEYEHVWKTWKLPAPTLF